MKSPAFQAAPRWLAGLATTACSACTTGGATNAVLPPPQVAAPGSGCNPKADLEACYVVAGFVTRLVCQDAKWQKLADCAAGQGCAEVVQAGTGQRTTICTGADAASGTPGADASDAGLVDTAGAETTDAVDVLLAGEVQGGGADVALADGDVKAIPDAKADVFDYAAVWACGKTTCASLRGKCLANPDCAKSVVCAEACATEACVNDCWIQGGAAGSVVQKFLAYYFCVQDACVKGLPTCGDGKCNGTEGCSSCAIDCGACPPPKDASTTYWDGGLDTGPTNTCGNGQCDFSESCYTCAWDCGPCPSYDVAPEIAYDVTTTSDVAPPKPVCPGEFSCSCMANSDCDSGICLTSLADPICTKTCVSTCPAGFKCGGLAVGGDFVFVCLPKSS